MIRRLQRKFVLAAMLSLLIVLALLIGLINILNYVNVLKEAIFMFSLAKTASPGLVVSL